MRSANGQTNELTHFVPLTISTAGITRWIEAFVWKEDNSGELFMLLGLPWLHAVNAFIDIRKSKVTIGDQDLGEEIVAIEGPRFIPSKNHSLILQPEKPRGCPGHTPAVITSDLDESSSSDPYDSTSYLDSDNTEDSESDLEYESGN